MTSQLFQSPTYETEPKCYSPPNLNAMSDLSDICRICGANNLSLIPLFGQDAQKNELVEKINKYLPITVHQQDTYPLGICQLCANTVLNWHELAQCCIKTEKALTLKLKANTQTVKCSGHHTNVQASCGSGATRGEAHESAVGTPKREQAPEPEAGPTENREEASAERPKTIVIEGGRRYGECGVCGKRVRTAGWRRHARSHGAKRHSCHACGRAFADAANLARHLRALHRRLRPHACPLCPRRFSRAGHLRDHVDAHSGRRDHVCDVCGKASASRAALRMHRRTHDARPRHACALCGAAFKRRGQLQAHVSVHTGQRDHVCACGKAFRLRSQLAAHARRHLAATSPPPAAAS